jgi:hypothetical protein
MLRRKMNCIHKKKVHEYITIFQKKNQNHNL